MKYLLFFLISTATASQEIPLDQVTNVFSKMESRVTQNTNDGLSYVWGRFIGTSAYFKWRYCFLSPINNFSTNGSLRTVVNPLNGKWFITNAVVIDQSDIDWCTQ